MRLNTITDAASSLATWILELPDATGEELTSFLHVRSENSQLNICVTTSPLATSGDASHFTRVQKLAEELEVAAGHGIKVMFYLSSPTDAELLPVNDVESDLAVTRTTALILAQATKLIGGWHEAEKLSQEYEACVG